MWPAKTNVRAPGVCVCAGRPRGFGPKTFRAAVHPLAGKTKRNKPGADQLQTSCVLRRDRRTRDQLFGKLERT